MTPEEHARWEQAYYEALDREMLDKAYHEDDEPDWDGDQCPNCGRLETVRIDTLDDDPVIWICQCAVCGETFEALGGGY